MIKNKFQFKTGNKNSKRLASHLRRCSFLFILFGSLVILNFVSAQEKSETIEPVQTQTSFRIGEKLTYGIKFGKFKNAGYAEIQVISTGKLGDKNAVELRSKVKTDDFVSAAFYLIDYVRTTFAAAETGLPLYIKQVNFETGLPEEKNTNYLIEPTVDFDLLTLIYRVRNVGGVGNFILREDGQTYNISFQNTVSETVETPAGNFETSVSTVQSDYLTEIGIKNLKINFSEDEARIPALIRFETEKGEFLVELASFQVFDDKESEKVSPTPTVNPTPNRTPTPIPTPTPFLENQALSTDLAFVLGETLEYKLTNGKQPIGNIILQAKERKLFQNQDSLLLKATVTKTEPGNEVFKLNDGVNVQVNPNTLAPSFFEIKFGGLLGSMNQTATFNQERGIVNFNGGTQREIPVGSHSILSLIYAIRSFNLKPSDDPTNPVNDTRVAVFLDGEALIFTLRPSKAALIDMGDRKEPAQLITIKTGNPVYDRLNLRLWLSTDEKRVPLRFAAGNYQADLVSEKIIRPQSPPIQKN